MEIFDMAVMMAFPYEQRDQNVFYQREEFKTRVINLDNGQCMPKCEMDCHVMFYVVEGEVTVQVNDEKVFLRQNQVLITEPAVLSMSTGKGVKIMGIQIKAKS